MDTVMLQSEDIDQALPFQYRENLVKLETQVQAESPVFL